MSSYGEDRVSYYAFFSEILEDVKLGSGTIALVGDVISGDARMNLLLGLEKAKGDFGALWWSEAADGLMACQRSYREAWMRYAAVVQELDRNHEATWLNEAFRDEATRLHEAFRDAAGKINALIDRFTEAVPDETDADG